MIDLTIDSQIKQRRELRFDLIVLASKLDNLVETRPGPDNFEPWAGRRLGE